VDAAPAVSVIVCTYNRCEKLKRSLEAIAESARASGLSAELIVVDNNSRDATAAVAAEFAREAPLPVRCVTETAQGLSYGRNRGIREAQGEICAFTDDDCVCDPGWVAAIAREYAADPTVMIVGGRIDLFTPEDRPITVRPIGERVRYRSVDQIFGYIIGANLSLRRALIARIGWFDPALGDAYGVTADDVDFIYRALRAGAGVVFTPEARVRHDHGRRTDEAVAQVQRGYARGRGAFYIKHAWRDRAIARQCYWELRKSPPERLRTMAGGAAHLVAKRMGLRRG
jgi:glycosyltransferase involved in cell wall biosynthesis